MNCPEPLSRRGQLEAPVELSRLAADPIYIF